ncbi:MAG TPA: DUF547 domain-containing protein [Pirellulales bacterium]|nr:DUF547 domain-containing protein [Pirellulales bacterium]
MKNLAWVLFAGCLAACPTAAQGGTKVTVGKEARKHVALDEVDHSAWNALLQKYCDKEGYVAYAAWQASSADVARLDGYLATLSTGDPDLESSREGLLAFWINAYNAVTVRGILREYPTTSIRNHTAKVLGYNIWHDLLLVVGRESYSLDTIEHKILRKAGENRIHFAIVCASVGCPRLRNEAYAADQLDEQLAENTRDFFSHSKNIKVDAAAKTIEVSAILDWFKEDFGDSPKAGLASLAEYLPKDAARLARLKDVHVKYLDYDWGLNDQSSRKTARR